MKVFKCFRHVTRFTTYTYNFYCKPTTKIVGNFCSSTFCCRSTATNCCTGTATSTLNLQQKLLTNLVPVDFAVKVYNYKYSKVYCW